MSIAICFSLTFALILINAVMGIFIGLDYYLLMASVLTVALIVGLILFNFQKIVANKPVVSTKAKAKSNVKTTRPQSGNSKRRIS